MMKSKLMNISIAAILCSNLFMGYADTYAEDIKAWFGNAENDYTENFENGETVFTKTSGNVYIDGTQNRVIMVVTHILLSMIQIRKQKQMFT